MVIPVAIAVSATLAGCATRHVIANIEPVDEGAAYQAQYRRPAVVRPVDDNDRDHPSAVRRGDGAERPRPVLLSSPEMNARRCVSPDGAIRADLPLAPVASDVETLSVGDVLDVAVPDDPTFTGKYRVSQDGTVRVVFLPAIRALGRSVGSVEDAIARTLVAEGHYASPPLVSVRVMDYASARVFVSGAVFEAGSVSVGGTSAAQADALAGEALGAASEGRRLSQAIRAAGGVRPDADLSRVTVLRGSRRMVLDLRPAVLGRAFPDLLLLSGDQIDVPSRGCFQEALMTPSPVSPPGVKVFMSNLTIPASSNAQSAISKEARELRWGTRLMQAAVGMNCVGGTVATNADRTVVLFSHNPVTGYSTVIERRLEDMLQRADRDEFDPYMMPEDALACYDSNQINIFDFTSKFTAVITEARSVGQK